VRTLRISGCRMLRIFYRGGVLCGSRHELKIPWRPPCFASPERESRHTSMTLSSSFTTGWHRSALN
jgi:hypothetical protein